MAVDINLIVLKTQTPEDLASFYSELGIQFEKHRHGKGPLHYSALLSNVVFEIYPLPKHKEKADDTVRLGFIVDDLDGILDRLSKAGGKIIEGPSMTEWGYVAIVADLDGRKIELKGGGKGGVL